MRKFSTISESVDLDKDDIESYFDFIRDLNFKIAIKDAYILVRDSGLEVCTNLDDFDESKISKVMKGIVVVIDSEGDDKSVYFSSDLNIKDIVSPSYMRMSPKEISEFFNEISKVLSQLKEFNPFFGSISSDRYFVVVPMSDLGTQDIKSNIEKKEILKQLEDMLQSFVRSKRKTKENPSGLILYSTIEIKNRNGEIYIDRDSSSSKKARSITDNLVGDSSNMTEILEIKNKINQMGWSINKSKRSTYQITIDPIS